MADSNSTAAIAVMNSFRSSGPRVATHFNGGKSPARISSTVHGQASGRLRRPLALSHEQAPCSVPGAAMETRNP
jgi:hypothetical protein